MQEQNNEVNAIILLEISDVHMHRFVNKTKSLFTSGICKIAKINQSDTKAVYFININSFYYTLTKEIVFVRFIYEDTVSFLFPYLEKGMSSITLPSSSPLLYNLEEILRNAAILTQYDAVNMDPRILLNIHQHCPNIANQPIYYPDQIKKAIAVTGKYLGQAFTSLGGYAKMGINKVGEYLDSKIQQSEPVEVQPQTKQKWEKIKEGTNHYMTLSSEYVNMILNPVWTKGKQLGNSISDKIDNSNNKTAKYAKELAEASSKAVNQAVQGLVKGTCQAGSQFSSQSKRIIKKKYGDDVIKTFIGEDGKEHPLGLKEQEEPFKGKNQQLGQAKMFQPNYNPDQCNQANSKTKTQEVSENFNRQCKEQDSHKNSLEQPLLMNQKKDIEQLKGHQEDNSEHTQEASLNYPQLPEKE